MAVEPIYRPQVAPGGTAAIPLASPADFGAGVGQGIEQLGDSVHEARLRAYQIERRQQSDSEAADFSARFAQAREDADKASLDARNNAAPGAPDHAATMAKWWEGRSADLLGSIGDDHVRRAATEQLDEFGGRFRSSEYQFQEGARIGKVVTDQQTASQAAANRARTAHDPSSYAEELSLGRQAIDTLQGVSGDVKEKLYRYYDQMVTSGHLEGLNDTNPGTAVALLDAGAFNNILTPEQVDHARNGAQIELRRADAAARTAASLGKEQVSSAAEMLSRRVAAGETPSDAEFAQVEQGAASYGLDAKQYDVATLRSRSALNRETQAWLPAQYEGEINRLAALGDKASAADQVRLKQLRSIASDRIATIDRDPAAFAAANGAPPPQLNPADPTSWRAVGQWADGAARALGRPVPLLSPAQVAPLAASVARGGIDDKVATAHTILNAGGYAGRVLDQVAPHDAAFRAAVGLASFPNGEQLLRDALAGPDALKANAGLLTPQKDPAAEIETPKPDQLFAAETSKATALLPPAARAAMQSNATNLYLARAGRAGWTVFHPGEYQRAIRFALGGIEQSGGLGLAG